LTKLYFKPTPVP